MKKKFIIWLLAIIILISAILFIIVLSNNKTIKDGDIYFSGYSDGISENLSVDWFDYFPDYEVKIADNGFVENVTEKAIDIQGISYEGVYLGASADDLGTDQIQDSFRGEGFTFTLNHTNGKLTHFLNPNIKSKNDTAIEEEKGKKIVIDFMDDIIDIDNFKYNGSKVNPANDTLRTFNFQRVIDGIKTRESIMVTVNGDGTIVDYLGYALFDFEGITTLKKFNKEEAIEKIAEKVKNAEKDQTDNKYTLREESGLLQIIDGKVVFLIEVVVENVSNTKEELLQIAYIVCDAP